MRAHALFNDALHVGNPEWQAAAGFRIGEMYRDLYHAIVDAPTPTDWDDHAREIYRRRAAEVCDWVCHVAQCKAHLTFSARCSFSRLDAKSKVRLLRNR